jgi:hypothetical protein
MHKVISHKIKTHLLYEFDGGVLPLERLEKVIHGVSPNPKTPDMQIEGTPKNNSR